jgi:hypothetical protein
LLEKLNQRTASGRDLVFVVGTFSALNKKRVRPHNGAERNKIHELNLVTELQVRVKEDKASHVTEITLSPEDMEDLAAYLTEAAKHARELKARIDEDAAEIAAAAEEALRQAKEAA